MGKDLNGQPRPAIEWGFGIASGFAVLCLIGFLAYQALFAQRNSAQLLVKIERIEQLDNGTVVTVAVANLGDQAAASVTVDAALADPAAGAPAKRIEFDYIAAHAVRHGAFQFAGTVSKDGLVIGIGGYTAL